MVRAVERHIGTAIPRLQAEGIEIIPFAAGRSNSPQPSRAPARRGSDDNGPPRPSRPRSHAGSSRDANRRRPRSRRPNPAPEPA
jgi:hypothetical protein